MTLREPPTQAKNTRQRQFSLDVTLPVAHLREGMFVSNVDCGWRNTPFALEGLLITTSDEIAILSHLTEYVTVDPTRCIDPNLALFLEKNYGAGKQLSVADNSETIDELTSLVVKPLKVDPSATARRADLDKIAKTEEVLRRSAEWSRLFDAPMRFWRKSRGISGPTAKKEHPAFIPLDVPLLNYPEPVFSWQSVPIAVTACNATLSLLSDVAKGMSERSLTDFHTLERAATSMAEHIIAHPTAILWAAKILEGDDILYRRSLEVGIHMTIFGRHLGFPREMLADVAMIGFLLDMGKTQLEPQLLDKNGPLTPTEAEAMQGHVKDSVTLIEQAGSLSNGLMRAVAEHHERMDGAGYPQGISDSEISLHGKMASIVDAYVAMVNTRNYAPTFAPLDAIRELFAGADTRWHGPLVEEFVQAVGVFPVGSIVELSSGHIAVVIQHTALRRLEPTILVVSRANKSKLAVPMQIDMLRHNASHKKKRLRIVRGLPDGSHGIDVRDFYFGTR